MPTYNFIHPDTKAKISITGDTPPDEATLDQIFRESASATPSPKSNKLGYGDILPEVGAIASEAAFGLANLPVKAWKGLKGLKTLATGGTLEEATAAIGDRNAIQSPWKSKMMARLGENVIMPAVNKTAGLLGTDPSNVAAVMEAGGDVASLLGLGGVPFTKSALTSPLAVAQNKVGNAVKISADNAAKKMMALSLKQPKPLAREIRDQNIKTALDNGFVPTNSGVAAMNNAISATERTLADGIAAGNAANVNGTLTKAIQNVEALRHQADVSSNPVGNNALLDAEIARLQAHPLSDPVSGEIPIGTMQEMKVAQGRELQKSYGEQKPQFQNSIDKARVRGMKEELEFQLDSAFPELSATNQKLGTFYALKKQLDNAAKRIYDNQAFGLGMTTKTGSGAMLGGLVGGGTGATLGAAGGALLGVIEHPAIAPLLARQIWKVNKGRVPFKAVLSDVNKRLAAVGVAGITAQTRDTGE
jgi:hypothetical protein